MALATFVKLQLLLVGAVSVKPNPTALPGLPALEKLIDGLAAVALLACVAGVLIGAAQWALGSRSNNYSHASDGRSKVMYGLLGAFVIGAAAAIINFFYSSGQAVK
ncbi:MAG TPA: DUF6112 family protein [Solirubrobacterales bacterium]|nr:DUF6112 family protein [Solirubrobacterales bacterium]